MQGEAIPVPPALNLPSQWEISPKGRACRLPQGSSHAPVPSHFHSRQLGARAVTKFLSGLPWPQKYKAGAHPHNREVSQDSQWDGCPGGMRPAPRRSPLGVEAG